MNPFNVIQSTLKWIGRILGIAVMLGWVIFMSVVGYEQHGLLGLLLLPSVVLGAVLVIAVFAFIGYGLEIFKDWWARKSREYDRKRSEKERFANNAEDFVNAYDGWTEL